MTAAVATPRRYHAAATQEPRSLRAAVPRAAVTHCAVNAKKVNHLNLMCINFMRKLPSGNVYILGQ